MFDFKDDELTYEEVIRIAEQDGVPPLLVAINANGYRQSTYFWGAVDVSNIHKGSELAMLIKAIVRMGLNGMGVIGIRSLYEGVRNVKPFAVRNGVMLLIKDKLIPELDRLNVTFSIGDKIYVSPAILDLTWNPNFKAREDNHTSRLPYHLRYSEEEVEAAMEFYRKAKLILNGK